MKTQTKLLNKDFLIFVAGWEFSMTGDALLRFALPLYILLATGNPALMGMLLTWTALPVILFTPVGGLLADRVSKRKLMAILNLVIAGATLAYALATGTMSGVLVTATMLMVLFTLTGLITPAAEATVPLLVPDKSLVLANSITFLLTIFSSVGAPILAGFMLESLGMDSILWLSVALFVLASFMKSLANIPFNSTPSQEPMLQIVKTDIKSSLNFIRRTNPSVGRVIALTALSSMLAAPVMSVALSVLVTTYFERTESIVGLAQGIVVFGGTFGLVFVGLLGKKATVHAFRPIFLILSVLLLGIGGAFSALSVEHSFLAMIGGFFFVTAFMTVIAVVAWSYLGEHTPSDQLGKIMALNSTAVALVLAIGNGLYGILLDMFLDAPSSVFYIIGALMFVSTFFAKLKPS